MTTLDYLLTINNTRAVAMSKKNNLPSKTNMRVMDSCKIRFLKRKKTFHGFCVEINKDPSGYRKCVLGVYGYKGDLARSRRKIALFASKSDANQQLVTTMYLDYHSEKSIANAITVKRATS